MIPPQHYFQVRVSPEQRRYARALVDHSLQHHRVPNVWDNHPNQPNTAALRLAGSLGELVFADAYQLPRPERSYGAADGQDFGQDFRLPPDGMRLDLKTMQRRSGFFRADYVLNLPSAQVHRPDSRTDAYFHLCLYPDPLDSMGLLAGFLGWFPKTELIAGKIGVLHPKNAVRTRADGSQFTFYSDTYEVDFENFSPPFCTKYIQSLRGFEIRPIHPRK